MSQTETAMNTRRAVIHFLDGTRLALEWPKQQLKGLFALEAAVGKVIESDQLAIEVEGNLVILQMKSVKFIEVIPAPEKLPEGILRGARRIELDSHPPRPD